MNSMRDKQQGATNAASIHAMPRTTLANRFADVRRTTVELCRPLTLDDYGLQAMPDTSPPKWHLAHTSWFFETFLLKVFLPNYRSFHPQFEYLFNSYYEQVGAQFPRAQRGLLSRPSVEEVMRYRAQVDDAMTTLLPSVDQAHWSEVSSRTLLGCHHEEQHQELLLTDIKYSFAINPLRPAYRMDLPATPTEQAVAVDWIEYPGGIGEIGHAGNDFAFDNEYPRHRVLIVDYTLASRLASNGEYLEFIEAGGYLRPEYWLADGWRTVNERRWQAPLYWENIDGRWWHYTLAGMQPLNEYEPVCHVSYYEADAFSRWAGKRLPSEAEWEVAAQKQKAAGNLRETDYLRPTVAAFSSEPAQLFGDVWEWTSSAYTSYPGYRPAAGALGEYNGKFMVNQLVLRGGSCVTSAGHIRASYRNFFYPADRWQFSGLRFAADV